MSIPESVVMADEILRLRATVAELVAEKEELRQRIANKEKAERELEEAEEDRKFRAKQQEFGDLLNRYEPSFPFRYRKFYINPFSNSSASGSCQKYKIPRKPTTTAEEPLYTSGQCDHIAVSPVGTWSTPAPHPWGAATAPAPRDPSSGSSTPSTFKSESGKSHRFTKLPPYCKKFLKGECSFGASCRFIHVSEGKMFAYLVNENFNSILPRRETKIPGILEARPAPRATILGGSSDQGCQPHPCRQKQPKVDAQHHKFLAESSRLELKLIQLHFTTMYDEGNKSIKATPEYSDHHTKTNKAPSKNKSCKLNSVKSQPKNTLKDFKASGKTKGLVHRSLASKRKKNPQSKTPPSALNIISHNIRGLASRKVSLEDILETNSVDICCVQEVNNKNPPKFKNYVQFNRFSKLRMHGVMILVHNSLRQHVIRVPDESQLECVHVRLNHTTPALNIIGLYLDVESRNTIDELDEKFSILSNKVDEILAKSEGCRRKISPVLDRARLRVE